jgi:hypothetical protein
MIALKYLPTRLEIIFWSATIWLMGRLRRPAGWLPRSVLSRVVVCMVLLGSIAGLATGFLVGYLSH